MYCASSAYAARMVGKGVQFVSVLSDWRLMAAATRTTLAVIHDGVGAAVVMGKETSDEGK